MSLSHSAIRLLQVLCIAGTIAFLTMLSRGTVRTSLALVIYRTIATVVPPDIVLIGDSLAQGCSWHGLGSGPLGAINLARRGTVIRQIVAQAGDAVRMHPHTVIVAAGTNDLLVDHAPASRIEFDFAILMRVLSQVPRKIVTLIPYTSNGDANRGHDAANEIIRRTALAYDAEVIDINILVADNGLLKPDMTSDGLHFSQRGCDVWLMAIQKQLKSSIPHRKF